MPTLGGFASRIASTLLCVAIPWFVAGFAFAQSTKVRKPPSNIAPKRVTATENDLSKELDKRIAAARSARGSADLLAAAQANKQVISLALRQIARLRLVESAYPQAIEIYRRSLDFEDSPETRLNLAMSELGANRPYEAIADSNRVLASDPNSMRALTISGRASLSKSDYSQAAEALSRAVQLAPDVETFYSLGISLLSTKNAADKARAAAVFQQMVQFAGDSGSLHVLFGRAYRDANDMPAATREFERAIALDTKAPHAHYFLALARLAVNEWKPTPEIRAEFRKENELRLDHRPVRVQRALLWKSGIASGAMIVLFFAGLPVAKVAVIALLPVPRLVGIV